MLPITPHVAALRIEFTIPVAPGRSLPRFVYAYLVEGADGACLIDSGVAAAAPALLAAVTARLGSPERLRWLVLTHSHPDHLGGAKAICEATGCRVLAHEAERAWIEDTALQARERPVPGFAQLVAGPVHVDQALADGDALDLGGGIRLDVLHTPGHSVGSIVLHLPAEGVLFSADTILPPGGLPIYDDPAVLRQSLCRLRSMPQVEVVLSSWDEPRRGEEIESLFTASSAYLDRIDAAVRRHASQAADPLDLARRVVAELDLPPLAVNPLLAASLQSHLRRGAHSEP